MRVYEFGTTEEEDEEDEFFKSTVRALNQLGSKKFGGFMISELQDSEFKFGISQGDDNKADANFNDPNKRYDGGIYMTGADIKWDGKKMISLGHELSHGYDVMNGYDMSDEAWDYFFNIPEREVRAVHMENILNVEQGIPLRHYYSPLNENRALVNSNGKEARFGYNYRKSSNVPWNYGNGIYGTCRTSIPIIPSRPAIIPTTPYKPLVPFRR
jgi:hypothetical protein